MIYIHVPFCKSFCTYCDYYSEIAEEGMFSRYTEEVCKEIRQRRKEMDRQLHTLYFGGGTPSQLPLGDLTRILLTLDEVGMGGPYKEFTMEVNPEDIIEKGLPYLQSLRSLGVNRISMGVQSFNNTLLRWMNRRHDAARARQAFAILREAGVENLSVDLIFGLPQLTEAVLTQTLDELLRLRPEHISAYQLSVEEGSTLGRMAREGRFTEASQEQCAAQYAQLCRVLGEAGYVHYEISNWALPGREAVHNGAYWTRHPYVGLGPAAHSFDGTTRSWNSKASAATASGNRATLGIVRGGTASGAQRWGPKDVSGGSWLLREGFEELTAAEEREEQLFLGLRTARGIPEELAGPGAAPLLADGRLTRTPEGRLRIPEAAWFVSDDIISDLI